MISIIFPSLNEKQEIIDKTIESIKQTSPANVEIIVIDDFSDIPIKNNKNIILERNQIRLGAAQSKHIGVTLSSNPYIFLTDSHVLFKNGWYENVLKSLENQPNSLYCGVCLGLSEDRFDLEKCEGKYCGARLFLYEDNQVLDGKWIAEKINDNYEISCIMGANYFMHKKWFFKIRGYSDLKAWGSEEPCLSMKTWFAGGNIKINKTVEIGHMFRNKAPYYTSLKHLTYNKIRMALTLLPEELGRKIISKLPQDINYFEAQKLIRQEDRQIQEYKSYYKSLFVKDIYWLCEKFNIDINV